MGGGGEGVNQKYVEIPVFLSVKFLSTFVFCKKSFSSCSVSNFQEKKQYSGFFLKNNYFWENDQNESRGSFTWPIVLCVFLQTVSSTEKRKMH